MCKHPFESTGPLSLVLLTDHLLSFISSLLNYPVTNQAHNPLLQIYNVLASEPYILSAVSTSLHIWPQFRRPPCIGNFLRVISPASVFTILINILQNKLQGWKHTCSINRSELSPSDAIPHMRPTGFSPEVSLSHPTVSESLGTPTPWVKQVTSGEAFPPFLHVLSSQFLPVYPDLLNASFLAKWLELQFCSASCKMLAATADGCHRPVEYDRDERHWMWVCSELQKTQELLPQKPSPLFANDSGKLSPASKLLA